MVLEATVTFLSQHDIQIPRFVVSVSCIILLYFERIWMF